jgi:hypothetical protein
MWDSFLFSRSFVTIITEKAHFVKGVCDEWQGNAIDFLKINFCLQFCLFVEFGFWGRGGACSSREYIKIGSAYLYEFVYSLKLFVQIQYFSNGRSKPLPYRQTLNFANGQILERTVKQKFIA